MLLKAWRAAKRAARLAVKIAAWPARAEERRLNHAKHLRRMERRRALRLPDADAVRQTLDGRQLPADPDDLAGYACTIMSQRGEDGIINEILRRAGFPTRRAVEVGCGANGG